MLLLLFASEQLLLTSSMFLITEGRCRQCFSERLDVKIITFLSPSKVSASERVGSSQGCHRCLHVAWICGLWQEEVRCIAGGVVEYCRIRRNLQGGKYRATVLHFSPS